MKINRCVIIADENCHDAREEAAMPAALFAAGMMKPRYCTGVAGEAPYY